MWGQHVNIHNSLLSNNLRIQFVGDIARIFYFFQIGRTIILTNGFVKKTRKKPQSQIELALKYKLDYERRQRDEWP